jgi:hypothetical protein
MAAISVQTLKAMENALREELKVANDAALLRSNGLLESKMRALYLPATRVVLAAETHKVWTSIATRDDQTTLFKSKYVGVALSLEAGSARGMMEEHTCCVCTYIIPLGCTYIIPLGCTYIIPLGCTYIIPLGCLPA